MDDLIAAISEKHLPYNGRIMALPMKTRDVVTIRGSVLGGWAMFSKEHEEAAVLAVNLLDAGTASHTKDELRDSIANRGARLSFSLNANRTSFDANCLPEDLPFMLDLIAECLGTASFPEDELAKTKARSISRIKNNLTNTRARASSELSRLLYDPSHFNYADTAETRLANINSATRKNVAGFRPLLGQGGLVLAIVGDIKPSAAISVAERAFGPLGAGTEESIVRPRNSKAIRARKSLVTIPHKANIDAYLGVPVPVLYGEPLYRPLGVLTSMLGGGFAAHLMQTLRERDGLTYSTYANLDGVTKEKDGHFQMYGTFAPELFERGIDTMRAEAKKFFQRGITSDALARKKEDLAGSYKIGLSTTYGLASTLATIGTREQSLSQLQGYLDQTYAVTVAELRAAAALVNLDALSLSAAGTFKAAKSKK